MFKGHLLPSNVVAVTLPNRNFATHCFTDVGKHIETRGYNSSENCRSNEFTQQIIMTHGTTLKDQLKKLSEKFEDVTVGGLLKRLLKKNEMLM